MYEDTISGFAKIAERKVQAMRNAPAGFFVASMLAGAYVGMGILLIFTLGSQVPKEVQKLVMGATFGIALTLVVIAGASPGTRCSCCCAASTARAASTTSPRRG
jgi:nitrite transporter